MLFVESFEGLSRIVGGIAGRPYALVRIASQQLLLHRPKSADALARGVIIAPAEQVEIVGLERPLGGEVADDRLGQETAAFEIVADDRRHFRTGEIDVDMPQAGRFADLVHAIGIRRSADEQFVDGIGDQRFGRPALLLRVAAGTDDDRTLTLAAHMSLEGLGERGKVAIVVHGQEQADEAGAGAAQAPRLPVCGVLMRFGEASDELRGAFLDPSLAHVPFSTELTVEGELPDSTERS